MPGSSSPMIACGTSRETESDSHVLDYHEHSMSPIDGSTTRETTHTPRIRSIGCLKGPDTRSVDRLNHLHHVRRTGNQFAIVLCDQSQLQQNTMRLAIVKHKDRSDLPIRWW
jgi:hypothetical protein